MIILIPVLSVFFLHFGFKDKTDLLARKWMMVEMKLDGQLLSQEMLERQRNNGMTTILHFTENGQCYVYVQTLKGRTTKRNTWKFTDEQSKIIIQPEGEEPAQSFDIVKLTGKLMILSFEDPTSKQTQVFTYKAVK
ncbi:MAG: hypothetical protein HC880_06045 [Bacteroidia bacterium]|nr:hypothetical protein [Bacteroidia bacterium]